MKKEILLHGPATTANVGPGYDIFAMTLANPYDEITIKLNDSDKITMEIVGNTQNIPAKVDENTGGLAIMELFKRKKITQGVHVQIHKNMISGSGLGTTGASAASCVYGLNKLLDLNLSHNEMIDIARFGEVASGSAPHADNVAAALLGGFILVRSYQPIDVLKVEMPEFPIVLAVINKTERSTRKYITYNIGEDKLKEQIAHCSTVVHSLLTQDIEEFGKAISVDYVAEPVRGSVIPGYFDIKRKVLDAGAYGCNVSGGGSSVFAVCPQEKIDEIADLMEKGFAHNPRFVKLIKTKTCNYGVKEAYEHGAVC